MTTKLAIYRQTLMELGLRSISDTGENRESTRVLNDVYDEVLEYCLEAGQWNFAIRTIQADADTGIEPNFGYSEVFAKPTDWVRTVGLSADEYNYVPLIDSQYKDEDKAWLTDITPIYVRYVSNDTGYGLELSRWPESFTRYVVLELAVRVCERLTQNASKKEAIEKDRRYAKRFALNKDALNEGTRFGVAGRLVSVRVGGDHRERGSRSSLVG